MPSANIGKHAVHEYFPGLRFLYNELQVAKDELVTTVHYSDSVVTYRRLAGTAYGNASHAHTTEHPLPNFYKTARLIQQI